VSSVDSAIGRHPTVAAFDLDGTLTVRDCVRPFLVRVGGRSGLATAVLRHPVRTAAAIIRRDRDELKEIVVGGVLHGRHIADVEALGASFAADVQSGWLRPDVLARLRWHQRAGHCTVIVSASLDAYVRPLGRLLGVATLCTELDRDGDVYGSTLRGGNCRGDAKAERLQRWIATEFGSSAAVKIYAYGDSAGDDALLAIADHPYRFVHGSTVPAVPDGWEQ